MKTLEVFIEELKRQDADGKIYIRRDESGTPSDKPSEFLVDGTIDLIAFAAAVDSARETGSAELVARKVIDGTGNTVDVYERG